MLTTLTGYGYDLREAFPEFVCESNAAEEFIQRLKIIESKNNSKDVVEFVQDTFSYAQFVENIRNLAKE